MDNKDNNTNSDEFTEDKSLNSENNLNNENIDKYLDDIDDIDDINDINDINYIDDINDINDIDDMNETGRQDSNKPKKHFSFGTIIRYLIMLIAAIVFLYSGFMLLKIYLEYKQGDDIYKSIADTVLMPVEATISDQDDEVQLPFEYDHQTLLNINSEAIGYLYIPSIDLRLPLVQGTDNDYYLTHLFNRTYNGAGSLFEDFRISDGLSATHVIIYGHNMKNGGMFAGLTKYLTPSFYQTNGNDTFYIYTGDKLLEYKIFTAYISEPISDTYTYNFSNTLALREYAKSMKQLSSYNTGVDVSSATQIVTFSTCTGDGTQRIIVQGMLINESPLE